jgi:hypothetical protein
VIKFACIHAAQYLGKEQEYFGEFQEVEQFMLMATAPFVSKNGSCQEPNDMPGGMPPGRRSASAQRRAEDDGPTAGAGPPGVSGDAVEPDHEGDDYGDREGDGYEFDDFGLDFGFGHYEMVGEPQVCAQLFSVNARLHFSATCARRPTMSWLVTFSFSLDYLRRSCACALLRCMSKL